MGPGETDLGPGTRVGWSITASLRGDSDLQRRIRSANPDPDQITAVNEAIESHIRRVVQEIENGIVSDLVTHDPTFDPDDR